MYACRGVCVCMCMYVYIYVCGYVWQTGIGGREEEHLPVCRGCETKNNTKELACTEYSFTSLCVSKNQSSLYNPRPCALLTLLQY